MSAVSSGSSQGRAEVREPVASREPGSTHQPASTPQHGSGPDPAAGQADFGANEWLVEELYQRYLADPGSVDRAWWNFFADYHPKPVDQPRAAAAPAQAPPAGAPAPARPATAPAGPAQPAPA